MYKFHNSLCGGNDGAFHFYAVEPPSPIRGWTFLIGYTRPEYILRGLKYFTQKIKGSEIFLEFFKGSQILTRSIFKISCIHLKIYQ